MHSDVFMNGDEYYDDDEHEPCSKKIMPALFAWFLLISTSASYFTLVLPEYINLMGLPNLNYFIAVVAVHSVLFLYVLLNFSIATFMDPGRFPKVDIKDVIEDDGNHQSGSYKNVLINDINVRMKWCTTCQFYRPPRSSHCGVCNSCIDTMDHHCPWVCNCIGRRNYKYFLQFLISLTMHMLTIVGLCITLVFFNKNDLTHIPIIISMFLIVIVGILIIPIGGLTGFHIVLVTRGRTTNEQVTGKFRTGVNPFDEGCCTNWRSVVCASIVPSYIRYRRNKLKQKEYLETKILAKLNGQGTEEILIKSSKVIRDNTPTKPRQNRNSNNHNVNETEMVAFLNGNNEQNQVMAAPREIKRTKKGSAVNPHKIIVNSHHNDHQIQQQESQQHKQKKATTKKLAKVTNNGSTYPNGRITSPSRQKHQMNNNNNNNKNVHHFDESDNENDALFQHQMRQHEKMLRQQQKQMNHHQNNNNNNNNNNNVWVNRKSNQIIYNEEGYDNDDGNGKAYRSKSDSKTKSSKHSSNKPSKATTDKINRLMNDKRNSIPTSTTNESSSNGSNRCIRNNSYLNANHTIGLAPEVQNHLNTLNNFQMDQRPPSSSSSSSNSSRAKAKKIKSASQHHLHHQIQLEIINEKKNQQNFISKSNVNLNGELLPDYASYEITV